MRNEEPCAVFKTRKKAVAWIKKVIEQTLSDLSKQDKTDEFNYPVELNHHRFIYIENRPYYLGL